MCQISLIQYKYLFFKLFKYPFQTGDFSKHQQAFRHFVHKPCT